MKCFPQLCAKVASTFAATESVCQLVFPVMCWTVPWVMSPFRQGCKTHFDCHESSITVSEMNLPEKTSFTHCVPEFCLKQKPEQVTVRACALELFFAHSSDLETDIFLRMKLVKKAKLRSFIKLICITLQVHVYC